MNNLLIQQCSCKLFKNILQLSIDDCTVLSSIINNNLYQLYYTHHITHALFKAELLSTEIVQFITDFGSDNIKFFIHHNDISNAIISQLVQYNVKHLSYHNDPRCITIPKNLINTTLFYDNNSDRSNSIVCFCEFPVLPDFLKNYLYPNTKLPIKLFNNSNIVHSQNLGLISELNRATILQKNKYYLALSEDDPYILEAQHCGSIVLQLHQLDNYDSVEYTQPSNHIEYCDFVKENLL